MVYSYGTMTLLLLQAVYVESQAAGFMGESLLNTGSHGLLELVVI